MFVVQDAAEIHEATERLSGLLSALDLGLLLPSTIKDLVAVGDRIERLGHGLKTLAAAKVAASEAWRGDGDRSAEDWLARTTDTSKGEANRMVETGKRLDELPATAEAAKRGDLSAKQAEAIAGAASADPSAERQLLESAKRKNLRGLQAECRRTKQNADPDPEATAKQVHAKRCYRTWTDDDGTGHLHLSGPPATIARMDNAIRHRSERIFRDARRAGRREPSEAYAFDAAEQLVTAGGEGTPVPKGSDAKIIVRVDHTALLRGRTSDDETCEIAGIGPIPVSVVQEWMGDAFVAAIFTRGTDITKVVHLGRRFTAEQRTALQWQDPICARRGCTNRLGLEYDHFEDWADTHTTRVDAAKRFCKGCHRLKSLGWAVSDPDPDGQCAFTPLDHPDHPLQQAARRARGEPPAQAS